MCAVATLIKHFMLIAALLLAAITPARQFATESVDRLLVFTGV